MESRTRVYTFVNPMPKEKTLNYAYVNELNAVTTIIFRKTPVEFGFMLSLSNKS